jgi:hypothetical protein
MEARKSISQVLRCWLNGHTQGQSPTKDEMSMLMEMTGLKMSQVSTVEGGDSSDTMDSNKPC